MKRKILILLVALITVFVGCFSAGCGGQSSACDCDKHGGNNGSDSARDNTTNNEDKLSPLAYFSFDKVDDNGNYYDEISGKAAALSGNLAQTDGKNGNAVYFDGKSKLTLYTSMPKGNAEHTIAAWIKIDKSKFTSNSENVVAGWGEYTQSSDTRLMVYHEQFCVTSFGVFTMYPIANALSDKWIHFALTYDGSQYVMYVNGIKTRVVSAPSGINIKNSPLYIGGFSGDSLGFIGAIDQLYVFDKSLNETQLNKYINDKGDFEVKKPDNKLPQATDEKVFDATNFSEIGWNDFVYDKYSGTKLKFAIKLPDNYDKTKKYPLIMFYHGDGSNGATTESVYTGSEFTAPLRAMQEQGECIVVVPVTGKPWLGVPNDVNTVYPYRIYDMDNDAVPTNDLLASESLTDYCADNLAVDKGRIYLCGYSRGAMASWYLLAKNPNKYAAGILCSGMGDPTICERFKNVPIWLFMGTSDPLVSYSDMKEIFDAYKKAGGNGRFTACTGAGHDVSSWLFNQEDLVEWLFSHKN